MLFLSSTFVDGTIALLQISCYQIKGQSLEQRKVNWKGKKKKKKACTPQGRSFYRQNLGWGLQGGVTFFWLAGGEITGWLQESGSAWSSHRPPGWGPWFLQKSSEAVLCRSLEEAPGSCFNLISWLCSLCLCILLIPRLAILWICSLVFWKV